MKFKALIISCLLFFLSIFNLHAQDFGSVKSEADLAYMDGKYENALELYVSIMNASDADSSDISLVFSNAGMCCSKLNQMKKAIYYFKQAVEYNVPQLMIYNKLISMTNDENDNEGYEFALLKKQLAFPEFEIEVKQKLAYLYYNTQQYEKLLPVTTFLLEWYPDNSNYYLFDAVAKQNLNDLPGAEGSYNKVLELDPDHAGANMGKGMIIYNRAFSMYEEMKNTYEALPNPDRVDYSKYRKRIEEPKILYKEALPYLLKAYENKAYGSLKGIIKRIYLRLEDMESAAKY